MSDDVLLQEKWMANYMFEREKDENIFAMMYLMYRSGLNFFLIFIFEFFQGYHDEGQIVEPFPTLDRGIEPIEQ